jgi:catecholate siderophore receptor
MRRKFNLGRIMSRLEAKINRVAAGVVAASALITAHPAAAAEAEVSELTVTGMRNGYDQPVITSATRTPTALIDTPQSISIISRALLQDQAMQGMADVVMYMPGVGMAQGEGNRNTPVMRGISSTANFYLDGVRDDVEYFRDTYNLERVEALKGPNAMVFGRGGGGGVINRVSLQPDGSNGGELTVQAGSWNTQRLSLDQRHAFSTAISGRLASVYENAQSYRDGVITEKFGVNPTLKFAISDQTQIQLSYEHFAYDTVADRGVPSLGGRPLKTAPSPFFGSPTQSPTDFSMDMARLVLDHRFGIATLHSVTSLGDYDKFYQNVYPGAINAAGTDVAILAYNNQTRRQNVWHQTDLTLAARTGRFEHTLLAGIELGRQTTDNRRLTGYFGGSGSVVTSQLVPLSQPNQIFPLGFRPAATDADNHGVATTIAAYVQDQVQLTPKLQALMGLRYEQFALNLRNNRNGQVLNARDGLWSPRLGLVYKPRGNLAAYASYSRTYSPRAGDQLAGLTLSNRALAPERFENHELGVKWDLRPNLSATAAIYQLKRSNVAVPDPAQPQRLILVDGQTSRGLELGLQGTVRPGWTLIGGYGYQDGKLDQTQSATAKAGARLANLPRHSASLWNRFDLPSGWGLGLGVVYRGALFTSTDNSVTLPGYVRADGAVYKRLTQRLRGQINIENLFDTGYFASAHNNNNITPGAPRSVKLSLTVEY